MHRFYLPPAACEGALLELTGTEAHHAGQVLRLRPGEAVTVLDGAGRELVCAVAAVDRRVVRLTVREHRQHPPPRPRITLCQAVAKSRAMDWIVQKATELGAARLVPVFTERSVPRLAAAEAGTRAARWREIALEAMKQCGTPWLPEIPPPAPLEAVLAQMAGADLALVAALTSGAGPLRARLAEYHTRTGRPPESPAIWVGPEGDFTPAELAALERAGVLAISLGPRVLRCETAALVSLALLNYELGRS